MEKKVRFSNTRFTAETISKTCEAFPADLEVIWGEMIVTRGSESWSYDHRDEFLADYRKGFSHSRMYAYGMGRAASKQSRPEQVMRISIDIIGPETIVDVKGPSRSEIERVMTVLENARGESALPAPEEDSDQDLNPVIFIGHGRSTLWRDLKDHLRDQHGLDVEAYETGARAGHAIRDILQEMLKRASLALLLLTAEDEQSDGSFRARENVVHETGLFQGALGFSRAIVLVEQGVEPFSNIQGIHQIRFTAGNIKEVYGDVLATIRREFPLYTGVRRQS